VLLYAGKVQPQTCRAALAALLLLLLLLLLQQLWTVLLA
jgi:hypothetical protein